MQMDCLIIILMIEQIISNRKIFIERINVTVDFINEPDKIADFIMVNLEKNRNRVIQ